VEILSQTQTKTNWFAREHFGKHILSVQVTVSANMQILLETKIIHTNEEK
jgi:hypothetical protein